MAISLEKGQRIEIGLTYVYGIGRTSAKKIIDTNSKLVENQNKLLEQNRSQEDDKADLKKRIDELEGQLRQHVSEEVKLLQAETRQRREQIGRASCRERV